MTEQTEDTEPLGTQDPVDFGYYCKRCGAHIKKEDIDKHVCDIAKKNTD